MVFLPLLPQAWWSLGAGSRQHCLITIIDTDDNNADADDDDGHGDDDIYIKMYFNPLYSRS